MALALVTSVILARALGPSGYGTYAFAFSIATLLALPAQVGIPTLIIRETSKALARKEWAELKGLWIWAARFIFIVSLIIATISLLVVYSLQSLLNHELATVILIAILLVPLIALGNTQGAALRGLHLVIRGQLPESIIRPAAFAILAILGWIYFKPLTPSMAMAFHVAAAAAAVIFAGILLLRFKPYELSKCHADFSQSKRFRRAIIPLAAMSGLQILNSEVGILVLGYSKPPADVATYKVAVSLAGLTLFGSQVVNLVVAPYIARFYELRDFVQLQALASSGALASSLITLPVLLAYCLFGDHIISALYGIAYSSALLPLIILSGSQVLSVSLGFVALLMNMTGHEGNAVRWLGVAALANLFLAMLLAPRLGATGVAFSAAISTTIWSVALWRIAKTKLGINSSAYSYFR